MTSEESLKQLVKQRLTAAAQQIFTVFQQNLHQCRDRMQRQRQLLDVIVKPERRSSRAEPPAKSAFMEEWESRLGQCTPCSRQEGEPLSGSRCDVGDEFVKQRICAAADDLWSLLVPVFTGQRAEGEGWGWGPGEPRPTTELPLLPVCKEEEQERSCTPHVKEEELGFCSTQDEEHLVLKQEEEEGTLRSTPDEDRGRREPNGERRPSSHHQTGSEDAVHPAAQKSESQRRRLLTSDLPPARTHYNSQNLFVDEALTAAVDDIFRVLERVLCTSSEKWEQQHPLLDVVGNSHQSKTEPSQQKSSADRGGGEVLWIKEEKVEEEPPSCSSPREEQLVLQQDQAQNVERTKAQLHGSPASLSENSHGFGSCGQTGSDVAVDQGTKSRPPAPKTKKTFECETCGKTSQRRYLHLQHVRTHTGEKPYTCPTCGNCFNQRSALNQHMRTHTGEKPFLCKTCGRSFGQASSLRAHRITHTDEKPHECRFCGMTFALSERLIRHTRVHTDERPYACQVCGKSFRQSTSLSVHLRVHSGERPYHCGFCGKGFVDKSGVNAHQKIHLGEKPHRCRSCGKFFRNSNQLKIHTRIHTGETPFTCPRCGRRFNQLASFQKHLETHGDHMNRKEWTSVEEDSPSLIPEERSDCAPCLQTTRP